MGHMHFGKQCQLLLEQIAEHGSTSIKDLILHSRKNKIYVSCSEGEYRTKLMVGFCFEVVIDCYKKEGIIEPIIENEKQRAALEGGFIDTECAALTHLQSIKWKFKKGKLKLFKADKLPVWSSITL